MRARSLVACALGAGLLGPAAGCERLLSIQDPVAIDGPGSDTAADCVDRGLPASAPLLLSEVVLAPTEGEMIEIVNPSSDDVDLSTYYLSDSGNYYRMPVDRTVDLTDFIVKFPDGAHLPGHGVITVAIDSPTNFFNTYSQKLPSYSLKDGSLTTIAMNGVPNLTNMGEPIILFQWNGRCDLVRDVDIMLAGMPTGTSNALPNKSNAQQDGPDPDTDPSTYAIELHSIAAQQAVPGSGVSTKRIALEDGHEIHNGTSNGPSGDDETSEDTAATWDGAPGNAFTAPTPGEVPPALTP